MSLEKLKQEAAAQFERMCNDESVETGGEVGMLNIQEYFEEVVSKFMDKACELGYARGRESRDQEVYESTSKLQ